MKYEFSVVGWYKHILETVEEGTRQKVVTFDKDKPPSGPVMAAPMLVDVLILDNGELCVLLCDTQAYWLCRFVKKDGVWQMRMYGRIMKFLEYPHVEEAGITGFKISPTADTFTIKFGNKPDEIYKFTEGEKDIKLNGEPAGRILWYDSNGKPE